MFAILAAAFMWAQPLLAQPNVVADVLQRMDRDRCASLQSGVKVCHYEYSVEGKAVEAIS
jgi:hypothetical protein